LGVDGLTCSEGRSLVEGDGYLPCVGRQVIARIAQTIAETEKVIIKIYVTSFFVRAEVFNDEFVTVVAFFQKLFDGGEGVVKLFAVQGEGVCGGWTHEMVELVYVDQVFYREDTLNA